MLNWDEYASLVSDGVEAGDVEEFIDTGSYALNALLSGSINGGLPANKITAIAGESATGKTFFLMGMCKNFLDKNPEGGVIYFESESAITKQMIIDRGIDPSRMVILPVTTYGGSSSSFGTYGGASQPLVRQAVEGSGFAVALRVNDGGSTAPYSLKGFQLEYQLGARR